ncbi:pilus assembly protein CpaE [Cellulomonas sp. PhB143]|uniref:pilus assembly protein CpaE n=1 Tax=Cellulomonas sp. PhB143 TaxID=2485186 RepID=UPI000F4644C7|nr:pilus assembly protein CpaE [Cellulomonas sp. PhB143]ROS76546.1 hypothetical protein EDF32_1364 [Cellulomonas sp. PhB143]
MISWRRATDLRDAGVRWSPAPGDQFRLLVDGADGDLFTVSDLTIEPHEFDTGVILGFNGTTEWALDSVALEDTLWHPREDQLRVLLGGAFDSLHRDDGTADDGTADDDGATPRFTVTASIPGAGSARCTEHDAADAYARAVLALVHASRD